MARAGLDENLKFKRLAQRLNGVASGMGKVFARGVLETLWAGAYERADDYLGDAEAVEIHAGWLGEPGALAAALEGAGGSGPGFIEAVEADDPRGGYRIHDLWDHAPPWVKKKAEAEAARRAAGKSLADVRREAGRKGRAKQLSVGTTATDSDLRDAAGQMVNFGPAKVSPGTGRDGLGLKSLSPPRDPAATDTESPLPPAIGPQPARATVQPWDRSEFVRLWDGSPHDLHLGPTGGNWYCYEEAATLIAKAAETRRQAPAALAPRLFQSFAAMAVEWGKRGRAPKGRSPEKFTQHFAAVLAWFDGVREADPPPAARAGVVERVSAVPDAEETDRMLDEKFS